ncbi:MAG: GNAT family N-acetyltransferase [Cyanobacteria bacterium RI_101]|nr:GNAT family N-acetyltransferase [Cyanobacteria bacterium RI_101]
MAPQYRVNWHTNLGEIPQSQWDALALPLETPFLEWDWLRNLETSGSVGRNTGWQPCHLTVWQGRELVGAAPLYLKSHSYGEFVFDHQWADLAHRLGINYYPKLLGMTPMTPAEGYQFLISPQAERRTILNLLVQAIDAQCQNLGLSGCHFLFADPVWRREMESLGFTPWLHHSYIWRNQEFHTFEDYLQVFNANQRRNIRRERKAVEQAGLRVEVLAGEEIPHHLFPLIYRFYSSTCDKFYWGSKYLTRKFFEQLYPNYRQRVALVAAYSESDDQHPAGLSFCLRKGPNLYGRYWGSLQEYDCLHFEACYYRPIQWAIEQNIQMFDPGAGGRHKRRRGFPATANYSLHRFYAPRMAQILNHYIEEINEMEQAEIDAINQDLPFSKREIQLRI